MARDHAFDVPKYFSSGCRRAKTTGQIHASSENGEDVSQSDIDWAVTLALRDTSFADEDGTAWRIAWVDLDGWVLGYRDAPRYDYPGCAMHRWFAGSVLQERIDSIWWGQ